MSAARALALVTEPADDDLEPDSPSAEHVAAQWEPENQLIGALLWLRAAQAQPLLELVPDTAIWSPVTRWAYELIRHVVDDGRDPNPVAVLAAGRTRCSITPIPDAVPTATRHHQLAMYLAGAYTAAIAPDVADTYARMVLDDAYRRAFDSCGQRMCHLAACGAERADLTTEFGQIRDELADLWRRCEIASTTGWWTP